VVPYLLFLHFCRGYPFNSPWANQVTCGKSFSESRESSFISLNLLALASDPACHVRVLFADNAPFMVEGDVDEKSDFTYLRIHDKVSSCHARRD
jgi:hypothetical protein